MGSSLSVSERPRHEASSLVWSRAIAYSRLIIVYRFPESWSRRSALTKAFWGGLMPATNFLLLLGALWTLVLILFVWAHLPERTIAEIIRGMRSPSWHSNALGICGDRATMMTRWGQPSVRSADRRRSGRWQRPSRGTPIGDVTSVASYGMKFDTGSCASRGGENVFQPTAPFWEANTRSSIKPNSAFNAPLRVRVLVELSWASRTRRVPHHGVCEEPMTVRRTVPTLLLHPTTSCPRCDGRRILALAVNTGSQFAWHECHQCGYLWAIPYGWMPHTQPHVRKSIKGGVAWFPVHPT